jgi:hypothetical protein
MARQSPLFDCSKWRPCDREHFDGLIPGPAMHTSWAFSHNRHRIPPVDLYALFLELVGDCRGPFMALRSPTSENFVHWHHVVLAGDEMLEVLSTNRLTEFRWHAEPLPSDDDWKELFTCLRQAIESHRDRVTRRKAQLEQWKLFVNPVREFSAMLSVFVAEAREQLPPRPGLPKDRIGITKAEADVYARDMQVYVRSLFRRQAAALALRMAVPVYAEAFVNLLLFLLARDELRRDKRLYEAAIQARYDVRVKSLSLNCVGFSRLLDDQVSTVKETLALRKKRNQWLHGNVDPANLAFASVYFDGTIPLFAREQSIFELLFDAPDEFLDPKDAIRDMDTVSRFIEYTLGLLEPRAKAAVQEFMENSHPGFREGTRRPGVLFSDRVVTSMLVTKDPDGGKV